MNRFPAVLLVPGLVGIIFSALFVASWIEFFWGDGDAERAEFCTTIEVFAAPLLFGSILLLMRKESGLWMLNFGSIILFCVPSTRRTLLRMQELPGFIEYMEAGFPDRSEDSDS